MPVTGYCGAPAGTASWIPLRRSERPAWPGVHAERGAMRTAVSVIVAICAMLSRVIEQPFVGRRVLPPAWSRPLASLGAARTAREQVRVQAQ